MVPPATEPIAEPDRHSRPEFPHPERSPEPAGRVAQRGAQRRGGAPPTARCRGAAAAPRSAQTGRSRPSLRAALPGLRIGTVDKFQGQEAPISVYSMATSSAADAPRGMEFLYSLNRLNVATSRAQCLAVVVASPELLHVRCTTPRQMHLANALARLCEVAQLPVPHS